MKILDLTNRVFGKLTAIKRSGVDKHGHSLWLCECECGNEKTVMGDHLVRGNSASCGCFNGMRTHGMYKSPEYYTYKHAKSRCENPDTAQYKDYGGRGIEFRFKNFEEFFSVLGVRPQGKTLDRIDNDGHYEKGNVRWSSRLEQQANRRISINKLMRTIAWG